MDQLQKQLSFEATKCLLLCYQADKHTHTLTKKGRLRYQLPRFQTTSFILLIPDKSNYVPHFVMISVLEKTKNFLNPSFGINRWIFSAFVGTQRNLLALLSAQLGLDRIGNFVYISSVTWTSILSFDVGCCVQKGQTLNS